MKPSKLTWNPINWPNFENNSTVWVRLPMNSFDKRTFLWMLWNLDEVVRKEKCDFQNKNDLDKKNSLKLASVSVKIFIIHNGFCFVWSSKNECNTFYVPLFVCLFFLHRFTCIQDHYLSPCLLWLKLFSLSSAFSLTANIIFINSFHLWAIHEIHSNKNFIWYFHNRFIICYLI